MLVLTGIDSQRTNNNIMFTVDIEVQKKTIRFNDCSQTDFPGLKLDVPFYMSL